MSVATNTPKVVDSSIYPEGVSAFADRKQPKTICMFDVDDTLTKPRQKITPEMLKLLENLRKECVVAFVGGSDFNKISEQVAKPGGNVVDQFDYCFAENGLTAYKLSKPLASASFIKHVGEEEYKKMVKFILRYIADLDVPVQRGTFLEFRNGMINISPIGRNASIQERNDFQKWDAESGCRKAFVKAMQKEFAHLGLTFSIGGQISFDAFPNGWDKTYSLQHIASEGFTQIHFFGDNTHQGGNDYEIFSDERTIGHTVKNPDDTTRQLKELFPNLA